MPSEKFRITTNGQSLRNPNNGFFGMTLSANMTLDESDVSAHNDRRSAHNALERQRREHLNVKFQQLAHALPSLQTVRRPSKTMIVAKSLEFVSSSLKRETTYTSEIQKLRLENEKLRKQAEASSNQLKKQIADQDSTSTESDLSSTTPSPKKTTDNNNDNASKTSTLIAKEEEEEQVKISRKRKANAVSDPQLSPPPTPEAMRGNNKHHPVVVATSVGHQQKKKKMVKQTKTLPVTATPITATVMATATSATTVSSPTTTIPVSNQTQNLPVYNVTVSAASLLNTPAASLIDSPWSPIDDGHLQSSLLTTYPSTTNNQANNTHNYFDMTSPSAPSNTNMLYDLYADNIHPMLLAPYYIPSETTAATTSASITSLYANYPTANINYHHFNHPQQPHQRHQSGGHQGHDFYLS
ncbi:uncharacterized protein ATC70_013517 [Mucor velutinosus]|uniref:BHLH domain-containing protein n=1 Tax=Mucor velutinosus TaxID=708070 RepID=A0AAN7HJG0_9FUNG|nr:hypothetical protein ATC70_013517 [Mucor velutinosus]